MLALGGVGQKGGYRRITFVPVNDASHDPLCDILVPLNALEDAAPGAAMPRDDPRPLAAPKHQEFFKESGVVLRWTGVKRAVRRARGPAAAAAVPAAAARCRCRGSARRPRLPQPRTCTRTAGCYPCGCVQRGGRVAPKKQAPNPDRGVPP